MDADPLPPLEVEVKVVRLLHLRLIKETEVILGRVAAPRVQIDLQEMAHQDRAVPRPQRSTIGGTQHGQALAAMSLIIVVMTAVSAP